LVIYGDADWAASGLWAILDVVLGERGL